MVTLRINEILDKNGKTSYWLAKQCDISQNNMLKICNGETTSIRFDTLEKICKTLECTPNDIFLFTDPKLHDLIVNFHTD